MGRQSEARERKMKAEKKCAEIEALFGPVQFDSHEWPRCRVCRCTEVKPCDPPCSWQGDDARGDVCTTCVKAAEALARWTAETGSRGMDRLRGEAELRANS